MHFRSFALSAGLLSLTLLNVAALPATSPGEIPLAFSHSSQRPTNTPVQLSHCLHARPVALPVLPRRAISAALQTWGHFGAGDV